MGASRLSPVRDGALALIAAAPSASPVSFRPATMLQKGVMNVQIIAEQAGVITPRITDRSGAA